MALDDLLAVRDVVHDRTVFDRVPFGIAGSAQQKGTLILDQLISELAEFLVISGVVEEHLEQAASFDDDKFHEGLADVLKFRLLARDDVFQPEVRTLLQGLQL